MNLLMYVERRVKKVGSGLDFPSADIALQYKASQIERVLL